MRNEKTASTKSRSVNDWAGALEQGGWVKDGAIRSSMTVQVHVGSMPVRSPEPAGGDADKQDGAVVCTQQPAITVTFPGQKVPYKVFGWDPGVYREPPCPYFEYGFSRAQTYANFKAALTGATGTAVSSEKSMGEVVELTLEHTVAGPDPNGMRVGGWASGTLWYGGWRHSSGTWRGFRLSVAGVEGPGWAGGEHYGFEFTVRLHAGATDLAGGPPQKGWLYLSIGQPAPYDYRICVCPYQFAVWLDGWNDGGGTAYPRSAFVSMPWVPEDYTGHESFVFVSNYLAENFRTKLEWDGYSQFDGAGWKGLDTRSLIVPVLRSRGFSMNDPDRLTTTQGLVLIDNAYITARRQPQSILIIDNRIAGKLWNCCTVSDNYPLEAISARMLEATWVLVSSHVWRKDYSEPGLIIYGAQKASVWWKVDGGDLTGAEA